MYNKIHINTIDDTLNCIFYDLECRIRQYVEGLSTEFKSTLMNQLGSMNITKMKELFNSGQIPPCMMNLYEKLTSNGHLKHVGRLQLGFFIKALGISLDSAIEFWRNEFSKSGIDEKRFNKEYA